MSVISSSRAIFLVDFYGQTNHHIFEAEHEVLGNLINSHGKHGIMLIKQYQPHKGTFKKLSKREVTNWFNWDTYSLEQLKKANYIK